MMIRGAVEVCYYCDERSAELTLHFHFHFRGWVRMDFYTFVSNVIAAERIVTQIYPTVIAEFEKRFGIRARKSWIDIQYDYRLSRHEIRIIIEAEGGRYYIPIGEISETFKLYGLERAFELILPPPKSNKSQDK
jgi:hypothetical protein